jgi:phosphatidylserine/phosphatidylglycerophosphate/cardiolipin synthase-like enzyme
VFAPPDVQTVADWLLSDRFAAYALENPAGRPVYVHAKVCVIDDRWSCVGSDNLNLRSWTHDSELSCAVMDADGGTEFGYGLRHRLAREHLDDPDADVRDPMAMFRRVPAQRRRPRRVA